MGVFADWSEPWFGAFREGGEAYALCPSALEFVDPDWNLELRQKALDYLTTAFSHAAAGGIWTCLFNGERVTGISAHTDGVWCWDSRLTHFVACHAVRLPDNFVRHMASHDFVPPPVMTPADDEWLEWGQRLPHPPFLVGRATDPYIIDPLPPVPDVETICAAANEAFRDKRYTEAASLFGSVAAYLRPTEARRHQYACKRSTSKMS